MNVNEGIWAISRHWLTAGKGQGMRYRKFAQRASQWLRLMTRVLGLVPHGFGGQGSGEVSSREIGSEHVYATLPV